jgi:dolichol-phosphate mannosyltransferase
MKAQIPSEGSLRPPPQCLSLIIPVLDEEEVLPILLDRLRALLPKLECEVEVVFVDDGSRDRTAEMIEKLHAEDRRFKLIQFSRNFGHPAAITAGLDHATGDAVVLMDADLQDPPELIVDMVARYREGYDVVQAKRVSRKRDTIFKRVTAALFYRVMGYLTHRQMEENVGEFRLMSRAVVNALGGMREHHRLIRGMVSWTGFRHTSVPYERPARSAGETKYPLSKMIRLSVDGVTSFSTVPLRLASYLGILSLLAGCGYAAYALYQRFVKHAVVQGWTSLVLINIFFSSIVLLCLGVVGEYVGRIFEEVKNRPLYLVKRKLD